MTFFISKDYDQKLEKKMLEDKLKRLEMRNEIRDGVPNKWFREYQAGKRSPNQIWHLAALEMWFETFIDK